MIKTSRNRNFIYSFRIQDTVEHANLYPDQTLDKNEMHIVKVIYQSFVIPADEDYLTARLLFKSKLHRGFFWSSSQCIEKYLKAFLLLHDVSVKNNKGHSIEPLFKKAIEIDLELKKIDCKIHPDINIDKNLYEQISLEKFLNDIENYGNADNRYNSVGVYFGIEHLFALDKFVFLLRNKIEVPDISDSFKELDINTESALKDYNPWFFKNNPQNNKILPNQDFQIGWALSSTWLNFLKKNYEHPEYSLALKWLNKKMKLPREIEQLVTPKEKTTKKNT